MFSADWLFRNHTTHLVVIQMLRSMLEEADEARMQCLHNPDEEIEAMSIVRPPLDGMPRGHRNNSPTERIALKVDAIRSGDEFAAKQKELQRYQQYVQLYELLLGVLNPKEQWFVEHHYNQRCTLVAMTAMEESPFLGYDRTTVWKFKKRLLAKADAVLNAV